MTSGSQVNAQPLSHVNWAFLLLINLMTPHVLGHLIQKSKKGKVLKHEIPTLAKTFLVRLY